MEYAIQLKNVTKTFGKVVANKNVNLDVKKGEILSLLGENGSGKTTLMNMISGIYFPDSGEIMIDGRKVEIRSPKDAYDLGIGMIHQHFKLIDVFSATENIALGLDKKQKFDLKEVRKKAQAICDRYHFDLDLNQKVYEMSVSQKQTLEIVKVLYRGANILILDEPTAVLTPQETARLFEVIRNMKADNKSVIIITHKLHEVLEISDRVAILRKGEYIGTVDTCEATENSLTEMMVGKKVDLSIEKKKFSDKKPLLQLDEITVLNGEGKEAVSGVSFDINSHEIVGVAGVANSGQKELCEAIAGLVKTQKGRIFFDGENIVGKTPRDIIKLGIRMGFIPEDRLGMGLVGGMDIVHNIILKDYQNRPGFILHRGPCVEKAKKIVRELDIQTSSIYTPVKKLSGGNVQKVLLGREIDSSPRVLITAYPVRGLDIGASYKIYELLNQQKAAGVGVLFVGEDLDVLMDLCDRVVVLCHGEVTGIVDPDKVTKEDIGLLMTGKSFDDDEEVGV